MLCPNNFSSSNLNLFYCTKKIKLKKQQINKNIKCLPNLGMDSITLTIGLRIRGTCDRNYLDKNNMFMKYFVNQKFVLKL